MTPYAYQPLTRPHETRVLIIQPGSGKEELVCNLSHIEVGSGEPYEALSYCWSKSVAHQLDLDEVISLQDDDPGKEPRVTAVRDLLDDPEAGYIYIKYGGPIPDGKIVCDGVEIPVGGELLRALTHMREAHLHYPHVPGDRSPLRIWVDAICINQADIQERTEHVKMMGSVYEHASVVRIWVGDEIGLERNLYQAFDDLRTIFTELKPKLEQQKTPRDAQALCLAHPKWYSVEWLTIAHFLDRAWVSA